MRNFNFVREVLLVHLKVLKEYKFNLYMQLITNLAYEISLVLGYFVLKDNFPTVFYWSFREYIFMICFLQLFLYLFHPWFKNLRGELISGRFNNYLVRPVNIFVNYMFYTLRFWVVLFYLWHITILVLYLIFVSPVFDFLKLFVCIIFGLCGGFLFMGTYCLVDSLAFFMKQNDFFKQLYSDVNNFFSGYPISFFKESPVFIISYFIGYSYFGFYVTDYYFGYIGFNRIRILLFIVLCLIFVVFGLSFLLWKFGVKMYEGFG